MMKQHTSVHRLAQVGMIAALYAVMTLILPIASFGTVQLRFSEVLTVLPVCSRRAVAGLTLGCAIANAVGVVMGANVAGVWDILVGSAATLIAALITYACRRVRVKGLPVLSVFAPVAVNAVIIGGELALVLLGDLTLGGWALFAAQVGLGQCIPCVFGGLVLVKALEKSHLDTKIFGE